MVDDVLHRVRLAVREFVPRATRRRVTNALLRAVALLLRGDAVECPCCGGRFSRFLRYPTLMCPRCRSYERHRLLCLYLRERSDLVGPGRRVLHVSPEPSIRARILERDPSAYLSIDLDDPDAIAHMDVTRLDLADASYDVVVISHVLCSVGDEDAALRELFRVLGPGGVALVQTPLLMSADEPRLRRRMEEIGFRVAVEGEATSFPPSAITRHGLLPGEHVVVARKPG